MKIFMSGVIYFSVFLQKGLLCSEPKYRSSVAPQIRAERQEISSEGFSTLGASLYQQTEAALAVECWISGFPASPCLLDIP